MCPRWLCAVGCGLALAPVGCFWLQRPAPPQASGRVAPPAAPADGAQRVVYDTRLIEQPVGDSYLSRGLWADATDPLPHQQSALLAANGLKVGLVSGTRPAEFDKLTTGEGSAIAPTLRRGLAGKPKLIPVNGPLDRYAAEVADAFTADPRQLEWKDAECGVVAVGTPEPDGRVTVRCQFHLQHGDKRARWTPTDDGGFDRTDDRPRETFPTFEFEVTLDPSDALVVGPTARPDGTLGGAYFFTADHAKQRVLVIRASAEK